MGKQVRDFIIWFLICTTMMVLFAWTITNL
jgi:hypothetical protein